MLIVKANRFPFSSEVIDRDSALRMDGNCSKSKKRGKNHNGGLKSGKYFGYLLESKNFRQVRPLNDYDQVLMKRVQRALIGEWVYSLSVSAAQAEHELFRLLAPPGDETRVKA